MLVMFAAITAIFADSEPVWIVPLVLHGCIVAPFAGSASKGNDDSIVFLCQCPNSLNSFPSGIKMKEANCPVLLPRSPAVWAP
jgi:hypothetical protein